jgi:hypothetical protein
MNMTMTGRFILFFSGCCFFLFAQAQDESIKKNNEQALSSWANQQNRKVMAGLLPTFFEKGTTKGTQFLSQNWMQGVVQLSDQRIMPKPDEMLYFNFNKFDLRLFLIDKNYKVRYYPIDSVSGFVLADTNKIYSFEKIPSISNHFFLQPLAKSEKGYSLYKRLVTTLVAANYRNEGYYTTGDKSDVYSDYEEYYLIYPDRHRYKKFYLQETAIRKALKGESALLEDFFNQYNDHITEKGLIALIDTMNDRNVIINK